MSNSELEYISENTSVNINGYEILVLENGGYLLSYGGTTVECTQTLESSLFDTNVKIQMFL